MPPPGQIKLCILSHASGLYGAEMAMLELIQALRPQGITAQVLVPRQGPLLKALQERDIPFRLIPFRWWVARRSEPFRRLGRGLIRMATVPLVMRAVRQMAADIVYTNTIAVIDGALAARLLGLPHVWHIHEYGREDHGLRYDLGRGLSNRLMGKLSDCVIANSHSVARTYAPYIPAEKLSVIYQSVTPRSDGGLPSLPADDSVFRVAILGYLQREKGQHLAVMAAAMLSARKEPIELWIIGSGEPRYELSLRKLAGRHHIQDRVKFVGYSPQPGRLLTGMNALAVCAESEAFGRTTIEGMLAGIPVVGANSGCTPELIANGETGLLFSRGDAADLAQKLLLLKKNPEKTRLMGRAAKNWAKDRFRLQRYGAEVAGVLRDLVL